MLHWLAGLPGWALFPLFLAFGVATTFLFDVVARRRVRDETRGRASTTAGVTLQVVATIYAILIAFVIVDEYTTVRDAQSQVSDKAAGLTVMFENSRGLGDADGQEIRDAALTYARAVVNRGLPQLEDDPQPDPFTDERLERLYAAVQAVEPRTEAEQAAYGQVLQALDGVARTKEGLIDASNPSIPTELFWLLVLIGLVVMAVATLLDTQHRGSHLFILSALALVIWLSLALLVSMNYPFEGIIKVSDTPLRELIDFRSAR